MSAPIIWIVFPFLLSIGMLFLFKYPSILRTIALGAGLLLTMIALLQPIGNVINFGRLVLDFRPEMMVLGRSLFLDNADRFSLLMIYSILTIYLLLMDVLKVPIKFIPLSLAVSALLVTALAVQPFLYAAVIVELAVLLIVVMVTDKKVDQGKGVIRFLVYLTLAMPFILFSGWILGGTFASPSNASYLIGAAAALFFGFAIWLAVFPFHAWVAQFSRAVKPYLFGFVFSQLPIVVLLIIVSYVSSLVWLRSASYLAPALSTIGIIMIVTTGIQAAVEKDLKRLLGATVLLETGFALVMISLKSDLGVTLLYRSFVPRVIALALLVFSLSVLETGGVMPSFEGIRGSLRKFPFASVGVLFSLFSIAGFPLFAAFPVRIELLHQVGTMSVSPLIWMVAGLTGFIIAVVKTFFFITFPLNGKWTSGEKVSQAIVIIFGVVLLALLGLIPGLLQSFIAPFTEQLPLLR